MRIERDDLWFVLLLAICVAIPFATHFYPTLDGAAHLYNSQLLREYLLGNATIRSHLELVVLPLPNYLDHVGLALLLCIAPAWLAEKLFICAYILIGAFGFRRLVLAISPLNRSMAVLVLPLLNTGLLNFGFYNFSLGVALLFWFLAWGWNAPAKWGWAFGLRMLLIATLMYFSNVLAFALGGLLLGSKYLLEGWHEGTDRWKGLRGRIIGLFLVAIPGIVGFAVFQANYQFDPAGPGHPKGELLRWLLESRQLVAYIRDPERPFTIGFTVLLVLMLVVLVKRRTSLEGGAVALPLVGLLVLAAYFFVPDGYSAGMMSDRLGMLLLTILLIWMAASAIPRSLERTLAVVIALMSPILSYQHWSSVRRSLDIEAQAVARSASAIPENAIVFPITLSDNWLHAHISNYLGVSKPMIILENYEARLGWFPLRWRTNGPMVACLGGRPVQNIRCGAEGSVLGSSLADHAIVLGDTARLQEPAWSALDKELKARYSLTYSDKGGFVHIYALR